MKYSSDKGLNKIEYVGPFSSQSGINVWKLKEAGLKRALLCDRATSLSYSLLHPFFPAISSSLKAAVLLQRDFLKAMLVLSEAPGSFQHVAATWESVDNALRVSADLGRPPFHTETPASNQLPNSPDS